MIKELHLTNFKGFERHTIEFRPFSVVVGHNNAGKSSAIEALRIVATVAKKFATHKYVETPSWAAEFGTGISPSLDEVKLKPETVFFKYSEPPAVVRAVFENESEITVFLGPDEKIHAQAISPSGKDVDKRSLVSECKFTPIFILPQISPLQDKETVLRKPYVQKCIDTQLSSRHFRNQIRFMYDHFQDFSDLFQSTWDSIRVAEFDDPKAAYEDELFLMLREEGFVAEVSNFGHGLQMWLQIVWFLARTDSQSIVIMDEPDVYMHPQQQGRMIELLRGRFKQCILSTHAPGILDHCEEAEILRLHRKLELSSCELDSETYESLLLRTTEVSKDAPVAECIQDSVEMKFVVYEYGSLRVTDSIGKELVNVVAKKKPGENESSDDEEETPSDFGSKGTLLVGTNERLKFEVGHPDDVSIYFDGETIVLEDYLIAGEDVARFTRADGVVIDSSQICIEEPAPTKADPSQVKLEVILGEYATVRVTDTNEDVILYLDSGKAGQSETYSIARQETCFEIANTSKVTIRLNDDLLDFTPFQMRDTAYFELDLKTMQFSS